MAMWGKVIGGAIGSMGGPIGIGIGAVIGHQFDKASNAATNEQQVAIAYMFQHNSLKHAAELLGLTVSEG